MVENNNNREALPKHSPWGEHVGRASIEGLSRFIGRAWNDERLHTQVYINLTYRQAVIAAVIIIVALALFFICARRCPCTTETAPGFVKPRQQQEMLYHEVQIASYTGRRKEQG